MIAWVSVAIAALCAAVLVAVVLALLVSLPGFLALCGVVLTRREWVPVKYNYRSLVRRKATTTVTLVAIALVGFSLHSALMMAAGISKTMAAGDPMLVKVLLQGTEVEAMSDLTPEHVHRVTALYASTGLPVAKASAELVALTMAERSHEDDSGGASLTVRGVPETAFDVRTGLRIEGRKFLSAQAEVMIGKSLVDRFEGARLGSSMQFSGITWNVVGIIDHGGTAEDSEVWTSYDQLSTVLRRRHTSINARFTDVSAADSFVTALQHDPNLADLEAKTDADYWGPLANKHVMFVTWIGGALAAIFSLGAIVGVSNTMYGQVTMRRREVGTMRALGYKGRAVLVSLGLESMLLGGVGGGGRNHRVPGHLCGSRLYADQ